MNVTNCTKFVQQLHERLKWAYKTTQHIIEKENKILKQNYDNKVRCTQLGLGDMVLKRMAFKSKHKIHDHYEKTIYCVEGQQHVGLLVFRITPVAGEGKVKIVHGNLLLPFGDNIKEETENEGS